MKRTYIMLVILYTQRGLITLRHSPELIQPNQMDLLEATEDQRIFIIKHSSLRSTAT